MPILTLDENTISKIAAGEVIERPASVVKELAENAIDAGSASVTVEISGGGIAFIRVCDNGSGMSFDDALKCFENHTTSKIQTAVDLNNIVSLGFRGEALYTIAAVAQVELYTRMQQSESGTYVAISGGILKKHEETGCPEGSAFIIRNLFYNTPARLKFLKKAGIEAGYAAEIVARLIMAHPEVSFKFISDGKLIYQSPGNSSLYDAVYSVYGKDIASHVKAINYESPELSIAGYIGLPEISRANRTQQSLYVNGRYVRPGAIANAVSEGYETRLMVNRFPFFALHLQIPPDAIDINVHPNKLDIRFQNEGTVKEAFASAVKDSFEKIKSFDHTEEEPQKPQANQPPMKNGLLYRDVFPLSSVMGLNENASNALDSLQQNVLANRMGNEKPLELADSTGTLVLPLNAYDFPLPREKEKPVVVPKGKHERSALIGEQVSAMDGGSLEILGTAFATYILVQSREKLYMIDQHAAHERILYEALQEQTKNNRQCASQMLLSPALLNLTYMEKKQVEDNRELFSSLGFQLEEFGPLTFAVRAVPYILGAPQALDFFREYLDNIGEYGARESVAIKKEKLMKLACRKAVKAGDVLQKSEIEGLIAVFEEKNIPLTCPHGRPVVIVMTQKDFEKAFKRIP
ncbi:MAG: DNA mismatch repair endonuclease MutL [Christensenellales bacterium]